MKRKKLIVTDANSLTMKANTTNTDAAGLSEGGLSEAGLVPSSASLES